MREIITALEENFKQVLEITTVAVIFPIITVLFLVIFFLYYRRISNPLNGTYEWIERRISTTRLTLIAARYPMEKRDIIPLVIITALFSFLALFLLGDTSAPQSFFQFSHEKKAVYIELQTPEEITSLMFYTGLWEGHYTLDFSENGTIWYEQKPTEPKNPDETPTPAMNQSHSHLFKWRYANINTDNPAVKFIRIVAVHTPIELGELAIFGSDGSLIPRARILYEGAEELFDEQELVPEYPTYMNGMYFDEIYHGRAGYELLRGIYPLEITHPPLGKVFIAASIYAFGMTPFGWRFIGAIFGVVMLIVLYIFIKNMFGKTAVAVCGTLLLACDFMRFVQTRIATIDTYGVLFILLAYFFMYRHITTDPLAPFRKNLIPLALSGIAFGIGCASKWIVVYAGLGLAIIFLVRLIMLGKRYKEDGLTGYKAYLAKTLIFSVLFFCAIPAIIYCLSYIPYGLAKGMSIENGMLLDREYYKLIWDNQVYMLDYHGNLESSHPYASVFWQWILDARPILYCSNIYLGLQSSFGAFGNPVVWWGGFIAVIIMAFRIFKYRDGKALFILIGYLSQLLPWLTITRVVFIYHYFPSTLFLVLALAHVFNTILERRHGRYKQAVFGYTAAAVALFVMFYPSLTGVYTPLWYFSDFLRWIPSAWPF